MKQSLTSVAKLLRTNQTEAEKALWFRLLNRQIENSKFRRQQTIGRYIVDFVSLEKHVIIEVDGGQHESLTSARDIQRTQWLEQQGFQVLRFWNNEILNNIDGVLFIIKQSLSRSAHPHPASPIKGEELKEEK